MVPGVYVALLQRARELYDSPACWDPRWKKAQHPDGGYCGGPGVVCEHDPPPGEYRRRGTGLLSRLDELEAGDPVTVAADQMPPGMVLGDGVRAYRVGSDDVVVPAS